MGFTPSSYDNISSCMCQRHYMVYLKNELVYDIYQKGKNMQKLFDINEEGFSVRCKLFFNKDIHEIKEIVIATHGFGGFKDNKSIERFGDKITSKNKKFGVICFDWPCHGQDARKKLVLYECLTYLRLVVKYAKETMKADKIYNYSVSFGAYLTLKYINDNENPFNKIALRSPGIRMYEAVMDSISEEDLGKLSKGKEITLGRDRLIKISQDFLDELKDNDITKYEFFDYADDILMIHGLKDEMIPVAYSEEFAEANVIELIEVEKADHRFSNPQQLDFAIQKIIDFFS